MYRAKDQQVADKIGCLRTIQDFIKMLSYVDDGIAQYGQSQDIKEVSKDIILDV